MSYPNAYEFVKQVVDDRTKAYAEGKRQPWSTAKLTKLAAIDELFDRAKENEEWEKQITAKDNSLNVLLGIYTKLHWTAGCHRDLRSQFITGKDGLRRTGADAARFDYTRLLWLQNVLGKLNESITTQRKPAEAAT